MFVCVCVRVIVCRRLSFSGLDLTVSCAFTLEMSTPPAPNPLHSTTSESLLPYVSVCVCVFLAPNLFALKCCAQLLWPTVSVPSLWNWVLFPLAVCGTSAVQCISHLWLSNLGITREFAFLFLWKRDLCSHCEQAVSLTQRKLPYWLVVLLSEFWTTSNFDVRLKN